MRAAYGKGYCDALTEDDARVALPRPRVPAAGQARRPAVLGAVQEHARALESARGAQAQSRAARRRARRRGGTRRLPALHVDRRRHERVAAAEPARRAREREGAAGRARDRPGDGRSVRGRHALPPPRHRRQGDGARRLHGLEAGPLPRRAATCTSRARSSTGTFVGERNSLVTKCPSKYAPKKQHLAHGRARARGAHRLPRPLALRARWRARSRPGRDSAPPGRVRAERARGRVRRRRSRVGRPAHRARPPRLLVRLRRRLHEREASARLHALGVLGRAGGLAPPLAARADGDEHGRSALQPLRGARGDRVGGAGARARRLVLRVPARRGREPVRDAGRPGSTAPGSTRAFRTRTWSPTRRCSISATSASRSRSRSRWARCSRAARTSAGSSPRAAGRSPPGRSSASASCSGRTGRTSRWVGAATTPGIRSRTPRSCRGSRRRRSCTR